MDASPALLHEPRDPSKCRGGLGLIGRLAVIAVALVTAALTATAAYSTSLGPAPSLCSMDASRGAVPKTFPIQACVDVHGIWLRNNLAVPVTFTRAGDTQPPVKVSVDSSLAANATRLRYASPLVLLPGDVARVPVGSGRASVTLASTNAGGFYALAVTAQTFLPGGVVKSVLDAFTGLIAELNEDIAQYRSCTYRANVLKRQACHVLLVRNVGFAFARAAVKGLSKGLLSLVVNATTFAKWANAQPSAVATILGAQRTISLAPAAGPPTLRRVLSIDLTTDAISLSGIPITPAPTSSGPFTYFRLGADPTLVFGPWSQCIAQPDTTAANPDMNAIWTSLGVTIGFRSATCGGSTDSGGVVVWADGWLVETNLGNFSVGQSWSSTPALVRGGARAIPEVDGDTVYQFAPCALTNDQGLLGVWVNSSGIIYNVEAVEARVGGACY